MCLTLDVVVALQLCVKRNYWAQITSVALCNPPGSVHFYQISVIWEYFDNLAREVPLVSVGPSLVLNLHNIVDFQWFQRFRFAL